MKLLIVLACLALAYAYEDEGDDKCRNVYSKCVKDGNVGKWDIKGRLACGKKYLECKKDQAKPKVECLKKCYAEGKSCVVSGERKIDCAKKAFACNKACFAKEDESETFFDELVLEDEEEDDQTCKDVYVQCIKDGNVDKFDIKERLVCGGKYLKCKKEKVTEVVKAKAACLKKCYDEGKECVVGGESKIDCAKKAFACNKACFVKEDESETFFDELVLEDEEEDDQTCKDVYAQCIKDGNVDKFDIKERLVCGGKYLKCKKEKVTEVVKAKAACLKKCYAEAKECVVSGESKIDCAKKAFACTKACYVKEDESETFFDELDFEDEEGDDQTCKDVYAQCIKDGNVGKWDIKERLICGGKYLKCKKEKVTEVANATAACLKKCYDEAKECVVSGESKRDCANKGFSCIKACYV